MTASYLTTDIVVIVALLVVLVLIGVCAFFTHFYWTKIGIAEIWNTEKWSSMRSSVYERIRRFSRASSTKTGSERPFSPASAYSEDTDGTALPAPLRKKKSNNPTDPNVYPPKTQPSTTLKTATKNTNVRRNSSNQVQPVSTISYKNSVRANYGTKKGQPLESTKIHNVHENDDRYNDPSVDIETHRF
jgi:Tfp pilus assembly protein PilX